NIARSLIVFSEDLLHRLLRWPFGLLVRPDDIEIHDEKSIRCLGNTQRGLRRFGAFVGGRQSFIHAQHRDSQPMFAGTDGSAKLRPQAVEFPWSAARYSLRWNVNLGLVDLLAVDPESQLDRIGAGRPDAAQYGPEFVLAIDGKPLGDV